MKSEIAIRGGTVIDGTGAAGVRADVGIAGGRIVEIAERVDADEVIDASGATVCPGFIDIHTHYDPGVLWDPMLTPSSFHGVTSVVAGNCGYSLAPTKPAERGTLLRTMDKVEDMQLATLEAGVPWDFETYGEYLALIQRQGTAINFGGYVGHTAVRLYVMGEAAYERAATAEEVAAMRAAVRDSLAGGALGFATDRAGAHLADGGRPVPSAVATAEELRALMGEVGAAGHGILSVAAGEDYEWLYDFQAELGRPISWNSILTFPATTKGRKPYQEKLDFHRSQWEAGRTEVHPQVTCRPIVTEFSLGEPTPFYRVPAFARLVATPADQRADLYRNPQWRAEAGAEVNSTQYVPARWDHFEIITSASHPDWQGRTVASIAAERSMPEFDVVAEAAGDDPSKARVLASWANDEISGVTSLLQAQGCILGLSDAGAHVNQMCDAIQPTDFLANWVRDRQIMSLEAGIGKMTGELADVLELDRGRIRVGSPADVLVLDVADLDPGPVRRVADMPAGGERLVADRPSGYRHIFVNGVQTVRDGESVVAKLPSLPGGLLRNVNRPPA